MSHLAPHHPRIFNIQHSVGISPQKPDFFRWKTVGKLSENWNFEIFATWKDDNLSGAEWKGHTQTILNSAIWRTIKTMSEKVQNNFLILYSQIIDD